MSTFSEQRQLWLYSSGWTAVQNMPERTAYRTFKAIADLSWRRRSPSVQRLELNLARVGKFDPDELRELTRLGARSYMRYWCDAFRMSEWSHERIIQRVRTVNEDRFRAALDAGRGVVVALPHMGNWDWAGAWACLTGAPLATVAERLRPEKLYERFVTYREALGMTVHPLGGDAVMGELADHLRRGGLVCLPAERDLSRRGIPVTLFGEPTRMPAGSAMLAMRTGAALIPATLAYEGREPNHGLVVTFHEQIGVPEERGDRLATMTQRIADAFESGIARNPEDWHMTQRMFLADLDANDPRRAQPVMP
ncbi:phosphatidylinositol mannoside acyltransferase [Jiangella asiatica]|uniref:Phosphatidylinositol mannoside acyltransferase n=1 Tax=Jiangella asiatica TaxID=2530372 RepID=A0A4R5DAU2_9ACTN|nr:phosphatidylinositol mannoside acyltransferase [Jiangella asiatica]TDE08594.1 phosphatidylinositol mannoside acyltransferase [Jiangella asiatica]